MRRIYDALFGDPKRLDRGVWLARFSDLVLNGIQFPAGADIDLSVWRRAIREGKCDTSLRGYSHVFVSGPSDCPECSDFTGIADLNDSFQEVFSRQNLRHLVLKYFKDEDPVSIRTEIAGENIWENRVYHTLSDNTETFEKTHENAYGNPHTETQTVPFSMKSDEEAARKNRLPETPDEQAENGRQIISPWIGSGVGKLMEDYDEESADSREDGEWLDLAARQCKGALQQFGLRSKLLEKALTPNAALLKFKGSANLTVEQVLKRRSEMLTTHGLNVISVHPEPGIVAISLARSKRRVLRLLNVWKKWTPAKNDFRTPGNHEIPVGLKEDDGSLLSFSPKDNAPHTLIAGSTGSGKSVLMQNIILAIACTNTPEQATITLIDPKLGVDYFAFENLPHIRGGVIDDQKTAVETITGLVEEMDRRYKVLRQNKAANIFELNGKDTATEHLPFLWVIHDEFAEWMMSKDYASMISDVVARLGVKARAAGIFLVFAAQRPDAHVMPMQLRSNLGNRLILRVDSEGTSEIALGEKGAERLLGKGHLAAKIEGLDSIVTAQVPFVTPEELERMVALICKPGNCVSLDG